jgi:ribosomal-protein-alanine N-acetyltransferase
MNVLETERLILRKFTPADAVRNYQIYTDPENMKFMGNPPDSVESEGENIQKHIDNYYDQCGYGMWAVILKENNQLIGRCGLIYQQVGDTKEVEVSYLLDNPFWGKGFATEAARQTIKLGFEKYRLPRIIALINQKNTASVRVAEKIGLKFEKNVVYKDFGSVAMYALSAADYAG